MSMIDKEDREERHRLRREGAERLKGPGVMDDLFAKIDAGEVKLDGRDGLIQQMIKAGLGRGLNAELTEHLGSHVTRVAAVDALECSLSPSNLLARAKLRVRRGDILSVRPPR